MADYDASSDKRTDVPTYRVLSDEEKLALVTIKKAEKTFKDVVEQFSEPSREQSIALTKIEEASMWAVRGLTK